MSALFVGTEEVSMYMSHYNTFYICHVFSLFFHN